MNNINPELLKRYADSKCTSAERELVEAWLSEMDSEADQQSFTGLDKKKLGQDIWREVKPRKSSLGIIGKLSVQLKFAACLFLFCVVGYVGFRLLSNFDKKIAVTASLTYKEIVVPKGGRAKVILTDGTIVHLNADTKLKYPTVFTGNERMVYLSGEGYFQVAKNAAKPFIIHTAKTDTKVLGTVFNLKAYPEEETAILTVQEGKVQFSSKSDLKKQLILLANQQGCLQKNLELIKSNVYAGKYVSWKDAKLNFNEADMNEIALLLSRQYNIRVENRNRKIIKERFTGTYGEHSLASIAADISLAFHCHYQINNKSLTFY